MPQTYFKREIYVTHDIHIKYAKIYSLIMKHLQNEVITHLLYKCNFSKFTKRKIYVYAHENNYPILISQEAW
jgi:hypothetical protein